MRSAFYAGVGILLLTTASAHRMEQRDAAPQRIALSGKSCGPVRDLMLNAQVPRDMVDSGATDPSANFNALQRSANVFSWQEFLALEWPALAGVRGVPDTAKSFADLGPRVWETWKEESEVYLSAGAPPKAWNDWERAPSPCGDGVERVLFRTEKIDDVLDASVQAAAADGTLPPTLTDQRGAVVRYEIRMNRVLFDYVVRNRLFNADVQALAKTVQFPDGAMLVKAAWREVSAADEKRYHTVIACVCEKDAAGRLVRCVKRRMGLVGLHVTQKTPSAPQWIWSTFEHVENVPGHAGVATYSFNDPRCPLCPRNRQTPRGTANQMVRSAPIPHSDPECALRTAAIDNVRQMNDDVARALRRNGSVFANYELVDTQWPLPQSGAAPAPSTAFAVRPVVLANTTMESFVQPTSTCMGCHSTARTVNANQFVSADFSFTLNNATPAQASCKVIAPPTQPRTPWDVDHWPQVLRGRALATQTYELLPKAVPTAKLHCASCHLAAGGNSDAAWWAAVDSLYPTRAKRQRRINQCFTNSMNGKALCTPDSAGRRGTCDADPNMDAFLTYIRWLDEQKARAPLCNGVAHGYPGIDSTRARDPRAGRQVFVQKCAVCHGADGQGRYERNAYFRPALWGPRSFNKKAGMFGDSVNLAAFLRSNMPLGAGGVLTTQESWNIEAYIHAQTRPGAQASRALAP